MIRKIILIAAIIIIAITTWQAIDYTLHKKTIRFNLQGSEYSVVIKTENGRKIQEITASSDVSLREGEYFYSISGTNYLNKTTSFTIHDDSTNITVTPEYTESYVRKISPEEQKNITNMITKKYSSLGNFSVSDITLHPTGVWASGKLTFTDNHGDIYRFIVRKSKDSWDIAVTPTIAISKDKIPKDIPINLVYGLYGQGIMSQENVDD